MRIASGRCYSRVSGRAATGDSVDDIAGYARCVDTNDKYLSRVTKKKSPAKEVRDGKSTSEQQQQHTRRLSH